MVKELEKDGALSFHWAQGTNTCKPPQGFDNYFGTGPFFRFIDFDGLSGLDDILEKIRDFPQAMAAEDTMRQLTQSGRSHSTASVQKAISELLQTLEDDPEIEGVLGYSEGATVAATLVLEERRLSEEEGRPRRIKCAIFLAGWPPLRMGKDGVDLILADECEDLIDIPTCHIVGCLDPYVQGSLALYNVCDEDTAELFDHGKGHIVPRDTKTLGELGEYVRRLTAKAGA